jgi:beta-lactamase class A
MRLAVSPLAAALFLMACADHGTSGLRDALDAHIADAGAETVGVYFKDMQSGDSVLVAPDVRMHAASMMKVPVMIQLFRDRDAGRLRLDDSVTITKTFRSIVDGSPYDLDALDDSDSTLYRRIGERESIRNLMDRMIDLSSNLATNMLVELVGADRTQTTMRELGADSIAVLRGVEDGKAYAAGLNNTTTARDLGVIFDAIAEGRAASSESCREMIAVLERQEFNEGIPAGLPPDARVAHKTGWITGIRHDGGIVTLPGGRRFVLVVLTRGIEDTATADALIADVARRSWEFVTRR